MTEKVANCVGAPARWGFEPPLVPVNDEDTKEDHGDEEIKHGDDKGGEEHRDIVEVNSSIFVVTGDKAPPASNCIERTRGFVLNCNGTNYGQDNA